MNLKLLIGIVLLVAGILALVYGGFSYTEDRHELEIGSLELAVEDKERVNIPVWGGVAATAAGALLLVLARRPAGSR